MTALRNHGGKLRGSRESGIDQILMSLERVPTRESEGSRFGAPGADCSCSAITHPIPRLRAFRGSAVWASPTGASMILATDGRKETAAAGQSPPRAGQRSFRSG